MLCPRINGARVFNPSLEGACPHAPRRVRTPAHHCQSLFLLLHFFTQGVTP